MRLQFVIDRPASECDPNAICIGPTAVDLSPLTEAARLAAIRQSESAILRDYRRRDMAHYHGQTKPWHRPLTRFTR